MTSLVSAGTLTAALAQAGDHLWQSTLFAAAAVLLVLALKRQGASLRYWIWFAASVKFLLPFAALVAIGGSASWRRCVRVVH